MSSLCTCDCKRRERVSVTEIEKKLKREGDSKVFFPKHSEMLALK